MNKAVGISIFQLLETRWSAPRFFLWQRHIGAIMTKHIMHQLLACSVGTRSKLRCDAKVAFFSRAGFTCACKHCEWHINTGVCSVPVFQCVLVSVCSPLWYLSEYRSTSAHRKHTDAFTIKHFTVVYSNLVYHGESHSNGCSIWSAWYNYRLLIHINNSGIRIKL